MNFHWGKKIAVFYTSFVIMMLVFVVMAVRQTNDLEREDYYEQEIKYQSRIDRQQNSRSLSEPLQIQYDNEAGLMNFHFPAQLPPPAGTISFYRPSDKTLDFNTEIVCGSDGVLQIPTTSLKTGLWQIQVEWSAGDIDYYDELNVRI